jgi:spermidine synthase
MSRRYWFVFFLVSGFCSLLYEVVWLRLAMASYGVTTPLVSIVLSTFMGGLALGSWGAGVLMSRLADRPAALGLRLYGAAEAITALSATVVPLLLRWGHTVLAAQTGSGWGSAGYYAGSAAFVVLALLPFCTCMGATFPLGLFVLRGGRGRGTEQGFSYLYLANVIGAAAGTLVTAFVLVELLGFSGTLSLAAAGNATIAAIALALSLKTSSAVGTEEHAAGAAAFAAPEASRVSPATGPVLAALFATGVVSMGMEVVWLRQLTPYLGNLVYCFAAVLFVYLVATVTGASLYRAWLRHRPEASTRGVPSWLWALVAIFSLLPLVAADPRLLPPGDWSRQLVRAVLAVAPFAAALGFVTPMLMDRWSAADPRRAGTAYGFNIVGCILGPLLAGFILLPRLGERGSLIALSIPLFAGTLLTPIGAAAGGDGRAAWAALVAALAVAGALTRFSRDDQSTYGPSAVVRWDDTATVTATGTGMQKRILVNGIGMTVLTPITKFMAHLPLALRATPPQRTLIICFGMGTSFRSALSWGAETTAVELVPSVPDLFWYYHADAAELLRSPRAHIVIDDGRRFLERSSESFDLILIDPPPPVEAAGSSLLYSRELYDAARRRLAPDGILQQWIPWGDPLVISSFVKTVLASFPYVRTFGSVEGWGVHVLASMQPIPSATAEMLAARLPEKAGRDLVEWGPHATPIAQLAAVLANERPPSTFIDPVPGAPVLVDDRPVNEYFLVRRQRAAWRHAAELASRP